MKLLLFYVHDFWMKPHSKNLEGVAERSDELSAAGAVLALVHAEPADAERSGKVATKMVKNIKWVAGKFSSKRVVLHYFAHLGRESADAELARELVESVAERLRGVDYDVTVTPYGYFTECAMLQAESAAGAVFSRLTSNLLSALTYARALATIVSVSAPWPFTDRPFSSRRTTTSAWASVPSVTAWI